MIRYYERPHDTWQRMGETAWKQAKTGLRYLSKAVTEVLRTPALAASFVVYFSGWCVAIGFVPYWRVSLGIIIVWAGTVMTIKSALKTPTLK